jgi:small subunit ribosomal protein S5
MSDEKVTTTENKAVDAKTDARPAPRGRRVFSKKPGENGRGKPPRKFTERPKPEFEQKILSIRRVTRVMAGGRRFSFSVSMLIGDKKGSFGVGLGKSGDTTLAISKSVANAKKNMMKVPLTKDFSIAHDVQAKYKASEIFLMPNKGKGIVAGGAVRDVLNLAGMKNVTGKIHSRSKNQINNARATKKALAKLKTK